MVQFVDSELELLKNEVMEMWNLVYNQVQRAGEAVLTLDKDLAGQVILRERRVNAFELKIDSDVEDMISLYNPVAVHLRFTLAILKINTNLERIGDFAKGIARFVIDLKEPAIDAELIQNLRLSEMILQVENMMHNAREALDKENSELANEVFSMDHIVDNINIKAPEILAEYIQKDPAHNALDAMQLIGIFRKLERVGDHCTNIAEEIIFYLEAKILKHKGTVKQIAT
jgi:phosphate transport system protein